MPPHIFSDQRALNSHVSNLIKPIRVPRRRMDMPLGLVIIKHVTETPIKPFLDARPWPTRRDQSIGLPAALIFPTKKVTHCGHQIALAG
jgi:hypothetical protein